MSKINDSPRRAAGKLWRIHRGACMILATLALFLLAGPAQAELLWEITHWGVLEDAGAIQPARIWFFAYTPPAPPPPVQPSNPNLPNIGGDYLDGSEGTVVHATPANLIGLRAALTASAGLFESTVYSPGGVVSGDVDDLWDSDTRNFYVTTHVPRVGPGLSGYFITDITQTIDHLDWTTHAGNVNLFQQQTIRIYGDVVPEPFSWTLLLVGLLLMGTLRQR